MLLRTARRLGSSSKSRTLMILESIYSFPDNGLITHFHPRLPIV
jgi:hypothetical protein